MQNTDNILAQAVTVAKVSKANELADRITAILNDSKSKDAEIDRLNAQLASGKFDTLMASAQQIGDVRVVASVFWGGDMRAACDVVKDKYSDVVIALADVGEGKVTFAVACGKDAVKAGAHAGNIVREIAKIAGGNGGGKPDMAMAGGKDVTKVNDALAALNEIVNNTLK